MLRFASSDEALQHLSDLTGKKIIIASEQIEGEYWLHEKDFKDAKDYEAESKDEDDELEVSFKFDYTPEERMTREYPGNPESVDIWEVKNLKDGKEINIRDLTENGILSLEDAAFERVRDLSERYEY
jgi:hypothetical protein